MYVQRIIELADLIEALPDEQFDMRLFRHYPCNTPGCIGGWAVFHFAPNVWSRMNEPSGEVAKKLLGLSNDQAEALFYVGDSCPDDSLYDSITQQDAAATLRHLAKTGEVKWN